jgi:hypothetical protein
VNMRAAYRALIIVAALALLASAFTPWLTVGPLVEALLRQSEQTAYASRWSLLMWRLALGAVTLPLNALVTGALTYALVLAAWTGRCGWLLALAVFGALAVLSPLVIYAPLLFGENSANGYVALYPYSALVAQASPGVIACALALVFAFIGIRRTAVVAAVA